MILKFVLFYGGAFAVLVATIFLWLFWRPELLVQAFSDDLGQSIRCTLRAARTLSPIRLLSISIPVAYVEAFGASPPKGFREKSDRFRQMWPDDNAQREVLTWSGRVEVARGQTVEISIPAKHPKAISGSLELFYEYRGVGGVLMSCGLVYVPLNKPEA